ncbi:MAG: Ig-like domain-containing protein, partial [bacterium]|nr:Ig-like domain-containing protein [bacterium]
MSKKIIKKLSIITLIFSFVIGGLNLQVGSASAALNAAGPISTVHGYPVWYQDASGLALQPCLGLNADGTGLADPNCVLPLAGEELNFNPAVSTSFPNNFPSEFFYYIGDAGPLDVSAIGTKAKFRMALEGAFASLDGSPAVGQQIAFLRINFAVNQVGGTNGLTPNSTYTINHPYGSFTVTTDALGDIIAAGGADFRAEDGAFTPPLTTATSVSFLTAVNTNIGPFLRAVSPAAPAGYIGNPNITQTIQAGPGGAVFSMTGPGVAVSTDQWALAGKIAVIDTIAPVIGATSPASVALDGAANVNFGANVVITDDLGVFNTTIDLGPLGNSFTTTLNGTNAGTASAGTGTGTFTIDTTLNTLAFSISIAGLTGAETSAHIHGPLQAIFTLPAGSPKVGTWNYPESVEADILAGNMSVQIHTNAVPAGEISGPILPTANVQAMSRTLGTPTNGTWFVNIPSATRLGTFNLPIVTSDGSNTTNGTMTLQVVSPLASVNVTPVTASVVAGNSQQLTASPIDNTGAAFTGAATTVWSSSDNTIATVSNTGLVTGAAVGTATITASVTGAGATVTSASTITVTPVPVLTTINLTPASATLAAGGATQALTAAGLDQFGAAIATGPITWASSNPLVASVSPAGVLTPLSAGATSITATNGAVVGTAAINVIQLTSVAVTPSPGTAVIGSAGLQMAAAPKDQTGAAFTGAAVTWASDNLAVATIGANTGIVAAVATGTANITATAASGAVSVTGTSVVTVVTEPQVLTSVSLAPATVTLNSGTSQLTATALDQFGGGMAPQPAITFTSSNPAVATIDAAGLVTAVSAGSTTITAASGALSSTSAITVPAVLTAISVTPSPASAATGSTKQLAALAKDQFGTAIATQPAITWSSDTPSIAAVDANGLVTASTTAGTATITAASGLVSGTTVLTVAAPALTSITISPLTPTLTVGNTQQFTIATLDQSGNAFTATTTLTSSNTAVGTINDAGLFSALTAGTSIITSTNGAINASTTVTVAAAPAPAPTPASSGGGAVISFGGGGGGGGTNMPPSSGSNSEAENQIQRQLEIDRRFNAVQGRVLGVKIDDRQVQIKEIENEAELVHNNDLNSLLANSARARQSGKETEARGKFVAKLKINVRGLSQDDESAITNFITYGTANTKKLGEGERAGVLDSYKAAYGKLPTTKSEWQDALKIAVGRFPGQINAAAEARAKAEFRKIYLRDANLNNEKDKA